MDYYESLDIDVENRKYFNCLNILMVLAFWGCGCAARFKNAATCNMYYFLHTNNVQYNIITLGNTFYIYGIQTWTTQFQTSATCTPCRVLYNISTYMATYCCITYIIMHRLA